MENVKQPAFILSVIDLLGLLGLTVYMYRKFSVLNAEINGIKGYFASLVKEINDKSVYKNIASLLDNHTKMDKDLDTLFPRVKMVVNDVDELKEIIRELHKILEENGYKFQNKLEESRPKKNKPRPRASQTASRRKVHFRKDEESEESEEEEEDDDALDKAINLVRSKPKRS